MQVTVSAQPREKNDGRKVLVNDLYPGKEIAARNPEWAPGPEQGKTPVVVAGIGGIEVATFTHEAGQDCHKHLVGTETYTVLDGTMRMKLAERVIVKLQAGDEVVVFPGTVHEVLPDGTRFLTRVHSINCYGDKDKYVKSGRDWCQLLTLNNLKRKVRTYPTSDLLGTRAVDVKVTDDELTIQLEDGRTLAVPLVWYPRLLHGSKRERARWRFIGRGVGIHWPALDEDIRVEGLLAGRRSGESQGSLKRWFEERRSTRASKRTPAAARRPRRA